jgi:hypothetical protein
VKTRERSQSVGAVAARSVAVAGGLWGGRKHHWIGRVGKRTSLQTIDVADGGAFPDDWLQSWVREARLLARVVGHCPVGRAFLEELCRVEGCPVAVGPKAVQAFSVGPAVTLVAGERSDCNEICLLLLFYHAMLRLLFFMSIASYCYFATISNIRFRFICPTYFPAMLHLFVLL